MRLGTYRLSSLFLFRQKLVIGLQLVRVEANRKYRVHKTAAANEQGSSDYIRSRHIFFKTKYQSLG